MASQNCGTTPENDKGRVSNTTYYKEWLLHQEYNCAELNNINNNYDNDDDDSNF